MQERVSGIVAMVAVGLFLGCSGRLQVHEDDDAASDDDDAAGDDDDAVGDDDDAVGDDDDAADDDDAGDDDDDAVPSPPGVVYTVPSGDFSGLHEYYHNVECSQHRNEAVISATESNNDHAGVELWFWDPPQPNSHLTWEWGLFIWEGWGWTWVDGGADCWAETGPETWPQTTLIFECDELEWEEHGGPDFDFDVVDGSAVCP